MGICWAGGQRRGKVTIRTQNILLVHLIVSLPPIKCLSLTIVGRPAPLLPPLVEVTAGTHEAADHRRDDGHKQENGGRDAGQSGGAEQAGRERRNRVTEICSSHFEKVSVCQNSVL